MSSDAGQAGTSRLELDLSWLRSLGWSVADLREQGLEGLIHPDDAPRAIQELERVSRPGEAVDGFVVRMRATDGAYRLISWRVRSSPDGSILDCEVDDVTERREAAGELVAPDAQDELFRSMADASPALMWTADVEGRLQVVNRAWLTFTGQTLGEVLGTRWTDGVFPADLRDTRRCLDVEGGEPLPFQVEYRRTSARGEQRWVLDSGVPRRDADGVHTGWMGTCVDIHDRKALEAQLRHQADHDVLTGLANRRRFTAELDRHVESARSHGQPGAVLVADIDRFKQVNDTLGHAEGDRLLVAVAAAMNERVRASDMVARLGGDEFAVVLARIERDQVTRVATSLLESIRVREPGVTISIGAACFDGTGVVTSDEVLSAADRALYAAKASGRDRAVIASDSSAESALEPAPIGD